MKLPTFSSKFLRFTSPLLLAASLVACQGAPGRTSLIRSSPIGPGARCELGGIRIDSGFDDNRDGALGANEVSDTQFVCNIEVDGRQSLVRVVAIPPSASGPCGLGDGSRVLSGIDINADGALGDDEVTARAVICGGEDGANGSNGANGANGEDGEDGANGEDGATTLVRVEQVAPNPAGDCFFGGLKITSGLDLDGDGVLAPGEIEDTAFVCSIHVNENMTLVEQSLEAPGANCENGGIKWTVGYDADGDKVLDSEEAGPPSYVCSQLNVINGVTTLLDVADASGNQCAFGGYVFRSGPDTNANATLDAAEVSDTAVVCNGNNGFNSLVKQVAATNQCGVDGGWVVTSGLDSNRNNTLDTAEIQTTGLVCNGRNGTVAVDGKNSLIRMRDTLNECNPTTGFVLEIGLDDNMNNILDPGEVDDWDVVCDGFNGFDSAVYVAEDFDFCYYGGVRVETGLDENYNGVLDEVEVANISYICDGAQGLSGLVDVEPAGFDCPFDGVYFLTGLDTDEDGYLDEDEIDNELLVCW